MKETHPTGKLRKDLEVLKKERNELWMKIVNIEKLSKENNPMIQWWWMYMIGRQSMSPSFDETEDEDEAQ